MVQDGLGAKIALGSGDWLVRHSPVSRRRVVDCKGRRRIPAEATRVVKLEVSNGATRSHRPQNAVALALLAGTVSHRVMASWSSRVGPRYPKR